MRYLLTTKETSYYGNKLNPERPLKTAHGIKGTRQKVIVTHNRSEIDQNQLVLARLEVTMSLPQEWRIWPLTSSCLDGLS